MKCPICGSKEYYEGLYGPNCGNSNCGKLETGDSFFLGLDYMIPGCSLIDGSFASPYRDPWLVAIDKDEGETAGIRFPTFWGKSKIPKRKRLKKHGR